MKKFLAFVVLFFAAVAIAPLAPVQSQYALPCNITSAPNVQPGSCAVKAPGQIDFFFASGGSDAAACTLAAPCESVTKANSVGGAGKTLRFNGGDTFSTTTGITVNSNITSYGTGQATISSGNDAPCIGLTNLSGPLVTNIICTGGGNATNTTAGISIINNQAGNTKLPGPTISGVTISGYGYNGISILGTNGTSGFDGITITGNTVHDCTGNSQNAFGVAGIMVASTTGYNLGLTLPAHRNLTVTSNTVYNVNGTAGNFNWSGTGMYLAQLETALITLNVVHDFGALSDNITGGPAGILLADGRGMVMRYNEVYNGRTAFHDGGGYVLDGGLMDSLMEFNYAHDNTNYSVLLENYATPAPDLFDEGWGNNIVRWNIFQNSRYFDAGSRKGEIELHFPAAATAPAYVYNNTIINQAGSPVLHGGSDDTGALTLYLANNIFAVNAGNMISVDNPRSISLTGNDYYTYGQTGSFVWNSVTYSNASLATAFAAWQTATNQEKISGSNVGLTVNPLIYVPGGGFTNGGYVPANLMAYNLQSTSTLGSAGINVTTQFGIAPGTTDYYGVAITAATLPVGAAKGDFTTFAASSTAASNFLARVSSFSKLNNVNYNSLLSSGAFAAYDILYVTAAPNAAASLLNLLANTFPLVATGAPTFTANEGYTGNGTTQFLDTGWVPSTNAVNYTLTSASHFGYALIDGLADTQAIYGALNIAGNSEVTNYPGTGDWYADANDFTGTSEPGITTSKGMFALNRSGTTLLGTLNGNALSPHTVSAVSLPNRSVYILATHAGSAADFSTNKVAAVGFGAGGVDQAEISRRLNSFMMANGKNVY